MRTFLIAAISALAVSANAAEAPVQQKPITAPSGLTVGQCMTILSGLNGLDGHQVLAQNNQAVVLPYEFGNAKLRATIQQNIAALTNEQQASQKIIQSIFKEIAKTSNEIKPGTPEYVEYTKQVSDAEQLPCGAILTKININDLKLDKNEIPGSVLGALDKILDK